MPVSIEEYIQPRFIKIPDRYPVAYSEKARYLNTVQQGTPIERYNGNSEARSGWKAAGYNVNQNSTRVERVNIRGNINSLKPY